MAIDEKLMNRVRELLGTEHDVEEKKMFSGMCFMVNGKMCVCVNDEEILCRIGHGAYEDALEQPGVTQMVMKGRAMKDYVFVNKEFLKTPKQLQYWVSLALAFNKDAKASKKKK